MAANTTPIFTITPIVSMVRISSANTNRDGTGTMGDVVSGALNGTRLDRINIIAGGTTTAGMVRLFIYDGVSVTRFYREVAVTALTPSATVQTFAFTILSPDQNPLIVLPAGYILRAATHNAENFDVTAIGGSF